MSTDRRQFLRLAALSPPLLLAEACAANTGLPPGVAATRRRIKALAFDAFPVFDPRPIFALTEQLFPGRGAELGVLWRARQFEYTWLRVAAQRYADFWQVTQEALVFAARTLKLDLDERRRSRLMHAYLELGAWPDVKPALDSLKASGLRLVFLSNFTPPMLDAAIANAGLQGLFEHVLSTDRVKSYKPDPRAYRMAMDALGLQREEILFVPFAGWDAAGARWFGYRTFWVNRAGAAGEELGVTADGAGGDLSGLVDFVRAS
ncbi:haloacid dehalogenase type II [Hyalangium sp.]|uniref:haloacid dehalogenase type II n=1 Tax=Hyalangium sp. TaxID=2028555 RepID=UPI002D54AC71|nr:haloacid dehalogenase type II [Hyalangium sp.]HYH97057.1 haloacid dehalogenase type II [Hyalangium sp.]